MNNDNKTPDSNSLNEDKETDSSSLVTKIKALNDSRIGWPDINPGRSSLKHGWFFQSHQDVLKLLIGDETRCIVELGSWLGRSAEYFAKKAPNAVIFAADLWDNSVILADSHYNTSAENLAIVNAGPIYDQFLSNLWPYRCNLSESNDTKPLKGVVPMKMDGCEALRILKSLGVEPDLIYVDACHHYEGVLHDISTALELFPSADIVGDDWDYPDVQRAVKECARARDFVPFVEGYKCWTFSKEKCEAKARKLRIEEARKEEDEMSNKRSKQSVSSKMSLKDALRAYKNK
mmetsp:Transcript_1933/g.3069  ORF Transcript_1933/g.3069 Transcript_1933/m.3069 type:complete len:290 (+) Transcript_1933:60-929(+)